MAAKEGNAGRDWGVAVSIVSWMASSCSIVGNRDCRNPRIADSYLTKNSVQRTLSALLDIAFSRVIDVDGIPAMP